jgi:hypothetical protein
LESFHWTKIFIPNSKKIDRKYVNVWLEDVPILAIESSESKVSELVGERVKIGSEEFSTENTSLEAAALLLLPKRFGEDFPLESCGSKISRVFFETGLHKPVERTSG